MSEHIIDEVSLGIYAHSHGTWGTTIFGYKDEKLPLYLVCLSNIEGEDIFDSSLSRFQIELLDLIESGEILKREFNKQIELSDLPSELKERLNRVLIAKVETTKHNTVQGFCESIEYYYAHDLLGYECR